MKKITGMDLVIAAQKAWQSQSDACGRLRAELMAKESEKLKEIAAAAFEAADEGIDIGRTFLEKRQK